MGGGRATTSGEWRCTRLTNGLSSHTHNAHDACNSRAAAQSSLAFNTKHTTRNITINTQNEPTHITRNRERLSSHDRWSRQIFRRAKIGNSKPPARQNDCCTRDGTDSSTGSIHDQKRKRLAATLLKACANNSGTPRTSAQAHLKLRKKNTP